MAKKKKDKYKSPLLDEQEKVEKLIKEYEEEKVKAPMPQEEAYWPESREFSDFSGDFFESGLKLSFFEKACRSAGNILQIGMKEKDEKKLEEIIVFTGLNVKPRDILSLSLLSFMLFMIIGGIFILFSFMLSIGFFLVGVMLLIGVQMYPRYLQKLQIVDVLNEMPLAITYLVIFMRSSPELEGAVEFTASHLKGPLGRDMRKLVWDVQSRTALDMDQALTEFSKKWKNKNKHFATALELIRSSEKISDQKERLNTLNEATNIVLSGNLEMMKDFARSLRMPVMALYMLGIVLPVMGLVLAPVIATMMAGGVNVLYLVLVYNIILPLVVYFTAKFVLANRPGGFTRPDIEGYPGIASAGHILIGGREVSLLPLSIITFFIIGFPSFIIFLTPAPGVYTLGRILMSLTFIWGLSAAIILYTLGDTRNKLKVRKQVEEIEGGLSSALFQLSQTLGTGSPIENAISEAGVELKSGAVKELFLQLGESMHNKGLTLRRAIFDAHYGVLKYYPSSMLRTIMELLVESTQRGLSAAARSLNTIGGFLKNLNAVKEQIKDLVGDTISTMKFQAQFLTAFMSGIIISMNILLFRILSSLGEQVVEFEMPADASGMGAITGIFESGIFNVASVIPAEYMQLVVGLYMIQVTVLISMLINGVLNGRDRIYRNYTIGTNLAVSTIVYTVALMAGVIIFSGFVGAGM